MAVHGILDTLPLETIKDIQAKAVEALLQGRVIMNYSDSGTNVGKQFSMPVKDVLAECNHSIRKLDPAFKVKNSRRKQTDYRLGEYL